MVATNRIADEHESLNRILQVAPYVPLSNIWFLWPYETVPKLHLDRFSHFVWFVLLPNPPNPMLYNLFDGPETPQKWPFPWEIWTNV